jgi:anti-sigma B factor antagonist
VAWSDPAENGGGIRRVRVGELHVVSAAGDLDLHSAPHLERELLRLIDGGARTLVVDLAETTFLDSTALGVLLRALQRLRPAGGGLAVVADNPGLAKIFEITRLDRVLAVSASRDEALARLAAPLALYDEARPARRRAVASASTAPSTTTTP